MSQRRVPRRCTECANFLPEGSSPKRKTCSDKCRAARSRRLKRSRKRGAQAKTGPQHLRLLGAAGTLEKDPANGGFDDIPNEVTREVMKEELRPVVREAITEDVLRSIQHLIALTPAAIEQIAADLHHGDDDTRSKAAKLILKYTVGHQALVRPNDTDGSKQLVVNFTLPRPDGAPVDAEVVETDVLKTCSACGADKPPSEMYGHSDRCLECQERLKARAAAYLKDGEG